MGGHCPNPICNCTDEYQFWQKKIAIKKLVTIEPTAN